MASWRRKLSSEQPLNCRHPSFQVKSCCRVLVIVSSLISEHLYLLPVSTSRNPNALTFLALTPRKQLLYTHHAIDTSTRFPPPFSCRCADYHLLRLIVHVDRMRRPASARGMSSFYSSNCNQLHIHGLQLSLLKVERCPHVRFAIHLLPA